MADTFSPPPLWFFILAGTIYILGLSVNQRTCIIPRWVFLLGCASICLYLVGFTSFEGAVSNFGVGSSIFTVLVGAVDFLVLTDVQRELRMVEGEKGRDRTSARIEDRPFRERVRWATMLVLNPRGIGWVDPLAPKVPYNNAATRRAFIISNLFKLLLCLILFDLLGFLNRANPSFKRHGIPVSEAGFGWRVELAFGLAVGQYLLMDMLHCVYGVVVVGVFGMSEPRMWPQSLFGSVFEDTVTVRKFWGRFWHQLMRRSIVSHASFLSRKLNLPEKSKRSSILKLFVAFFLSAFIHFAGDYMCFRQWNSGGSFIFFMVQPFAIVFEEVVMMFFSRRWKAHMMPTTWMGALITRAVGYVWVSLWFSYTVPIFLEPLLRAGFFESGPSFSLILGVVRGEWMP